MFVAGIEIFFGFVAGAVLLAVGIMLSTVLFHAFIAICKLVFAALRQVWKFLKAPLTIGSAIVTFLLSAIAGLIWGDDMGLATGLTSGMIGLCFSYYAFTNLNKSPSSPASSPEKLQ